MNPHAWVTSYEVVVCACGEHIPGGRDGHTHHTFLNLDYRTMREDLFHTTIDLYRRMGPERGGGHGMVKRTRDRRRCWRKTPMQPHPVFVNGERL